jgi:uncharacterized Ntn-hydrolase superfamily protein
MTYTILGYCEQTGRVGVAIATYSLAVGGLCPAVVSNAGALTSQAFVNPELRVLGAGLISAGHPAPQTLALMKQADPHPLIEYRQLAVIDAHGRSAAFTGSRTRSWAGHVVERGCVALGNVLAGKHVVRAMADAFETSPDQPLADRLMLALEAGREAGGQVGGQGHLPERSAALLVHHRALYAELDLRVDLHDDAVTALRAMHDEYRPYVAFHHLRHVDPAEAQPQEAFVADLAAKRMRSD